MEQQVAARTTKLVLALDVSPRTWRLAAPRLDSVYPRLRELHLILAAEREGQAPPPTPPMPQTPAPSPRQPALPGGSAAAAAAAGPGPGSAALVAAAAASGAGVSPRGWRPWLSPRSRSCGSAGSQSPVPSSPRSPHATRLADRGAGAGTGPQGHPSGPECLRDFLSWSACGHLTGLTLLDLSRCGSLRLQRDTWAALVEALGPGEVVLRVPWRCLLAHGTSSGSGSGGSGGGKGSGRGRGDGGAGGRGGDAASSGSITSPLSPHGGGAASAPTWLPPRCVCSFCGASPPDAAPVLAALVVLGQLRPAAAVELVGRGLPLRSPAALQQLCAVSQLASVSLALCAVRPLAHHAGWLSCLRRLHSLELRYREEPGAEGAGGGGGAAAAAEASTSSTALAQILRALQDPVPLRSLTLSRSAPPGAPSAPMLLLGEPELAALAALPRLAELDAPGMRIHGPTQLALTGLTRLSLRSERLELAQPLAAVFPGLEHLDLGVGVNDLPPTAVLAEAAAAGAPHGLQNLAAPAGPAAGDVAAGAAAPAGGAGEVDAAGLPAAAAAPPPAHPAQLQAAAAAAAAPPGPRLPGELHLHLRLLQGLSGLQALSIGGKPGHGVEALSSLTALSSLVFVRCSEFRPLRKAVEELRGLSCLRSLELHACLGGDACGYEIARLLRRLQKLPGLARLVLHGVDPRLPQQLATAPLGRLSELALLGLPELQPLDLRYVLQAQTALRRLAVRGCARLDRPTVEALVAAHRPALALEWGQ
ncbi:hypothetical protein GPECTOR_35g887 [Gonium pectorale]|uniref:Uncharacterized protein n=1 Tax=Gonium pectorale TaxID=33097 RepID=A0A150GC95_GONPE|nr:hypothetical protein GPECTOR_35g887 [Gonium pectorale]|eukprot:KXZ47449.1 hypothetical protein GPECTOR_35g887 [Gonium pectorale]